MDTNSPLSDDQMINESYKKNPYALWMIIGSLFLLIVSLLVGRDWVEEGGVLVDGKKSPFQEVTNREFSTFLWYNPEFMRANVSMKTAYLSGFQYIEKLSVEPEMAENRVNAPPEVLFFYHAWRRLLSQTILVGPIYADEFRSFVDYAEEWQPKYWKGATEQYRALVAERSEGRDDIRDQIPDEVALAFQGWKYFFLEGKRVEQFKPTFAQVGEFIEVFPQYRRSYWKNIVGEQYLQSFNNVRNHPDALVPRKELTGFLKIGLYNYLRSREAMAKPSS